MRLSQLNTINFVKYFELINTRKYIGMYIKKLQTYFKTT